MLALSTYLSRYECRGEGPAPRPCPQSPMHAYLKPSCGSPPPPSLSRVKKTKNKKKYGAPISRCERSHLPQGPELCGHLSLDLLPGPRPPPPPPRQEAQGARNKDGIGQRENVKEAKNKRGLAPPSTNCPKPASSQACCLCCVACLLSTPVTLSASPPPSGSPGRF